MWLYKDWVVKVRQKKKMHGQWKHGHVPRQEYAVQMCRDGIKNAKAQMELSVVTDAKNNEKGFYR